MLLVVLGLTLLAILVTAVGLGADWISSRASFVFLHQLAKCEDRFTDSWKQFGSLANSLFLPKAAITLIKSSFLVAAGIFVGIALLGDLQARQLGQSTIWVFIIGALVLAATWLLLGLAEFFLGNVVLQIMYARRVRVREACDDGMRLLRKYPGTFVLYWLMKVALTIGALFASIMILYMTCCLCLLGAIPVVGDVLLTVVTLPVWVALMAYSAYFIQQFGSEYNIMDDPYDTGAHGGVAATAPQPPREWAPPGPRRPLPAGDPTEIPSPGKAPPGNT